MISLTVKTKLLIWVARLIAHLHSTINDDWVRPLNKSKSARKSISHCNLLIWIMNFSTWLAAARIAQHFVKWLGKWRNSASSMEWLEDYSLKADCTACALVLFVTKHGISLSATFMPCRFPLHLTFPFDFMLDQRRNVDEKKKLVRRQEKAKRRPRMRKQFFMFIARLLTAACRLATAKAEKHFSYNFLMDIECSGAPWRRRSTM